MSDRFYLGMAVLSLVLHGGRFAKDAWQHADDWFICGLLAAMAATWMWASWKVWEMREGK